jgi:hypothetical protein
MKKLSISIILMSFVFIGFSQLNTGSESPKRNSVYLEVYGQGYYNSICFDRLYNMNKKVKTSVTAALTLVPYFSRHNDYLFVIGVPVSYNWLFGKRKSHLELGLGLTVSSQTYNDFYLSETGARMTTNYIYLTPKIGYRFQKPQGGFFFRACLTPLYDLYKSNQFKDRFTKFPAPLAFQQQMNTRQLYPWLGLSFGYTLK